MSDCLTPDEVHAIAEGRSPGRGDEVADTHLASCEACRAALLKQFRTSTSASVTEDSRSTPGLEADTTFVVTPVPGRYRHSSRGDGALEELGRGGFGKVVLARDLMVGRDVAVKLLTRQRLERGREVAEARLLREARVMGQLEHPAIVPLHELGRDESGALYYTMRRIRGRTLADAISAEPTLAGRLRLLPHVLTACHAIAYAHSRGVLHRDLKPQNVMLDRFGATYVIDWGLAHARALPGEVASPESSGALQMVTSDETIGDEHGRLGTPAYMSPEQLAGPRGLIDERSDVWGLGALLFQVLTGRPPRERAAGTSAQGPGPVGALATEVPPDLAAICTKACAEDREARYASAEAMAFDLDAWLHGRQVSAHTYRPMELVGRFAREHRLALSVAALGLVALLVVGVEAFVRVRAQRNHARTFAHLIVDQVLDRLTETKDAQFAEALTTTVSDWLQQEGQDDDDTAALAWAWFQLARDVDRVRVAPPVYLRSCLEAAKASASVDAWAARLGCRTLELAPYDVYELDDGSIAALRALEREPAPPGAAGSLRWLKARRFLLERLTFLSNARTDPDDDVGDADALVAAARAVLNASSTSGAALVPMSNALSHRAIAASNASQGAQALALATEAVEVARRAVVARRDADALEELASALTNLVSLSRWHAEVAGPGWEARREVAGAEARRIYEALHLLDPTSTSLAEGKAGLLLELGDGAAAWEALREVSFARCGSICRSEYVFAALAAGKAREVLAVRAGIEVAPSFDTQCALGLALAVEGQRQKAAEALRRCATYPASTAWPAPAMDAYAATLKGADAEPLRALIEAFKVAQTGNDEAGFSRAIAAMVKALEAAER